jgi:hypothetical protein
MFVAPKHLTAESTLADLPSHNFQVDAAALGQVVDVHFEKYVNLPGVIVRDGPDLIGVISRQAFFQQMSRLFSREIYMRRPIRLVFHPDQHSPCCLPASCHEGPGFDTAILAAAADVASHDSAHGRGVMLMRSFTDDVRYNETGNAVTLTKRLNSPPKAAAET